MPTIKRTGKINLLAIVVTLALVAFQLVRVIAFIDEYGGIEHDGGWFLTVSRSLAERGEFTTLVSTIVDPAAPGAIDIDQKFNIQADDGRIWFFTGNGNGPVSIIANALVLRVLGFDFWALRTGPLLFYVAFLLLAAYILYRLAGLWAVGLFHAFIFFYPHLSIFLGYEAMGEVPSMVFILLTYLAFAWAASQSRRRWLAFFLAGLLAGLTLNTKLITLWSVSGVFVWAGLLWLAGLTERGRQLTVVRLRFGELVWLGLGIPLTLALWELVQLAVLVRRVGFELYRQHFLQRIKFVLDDGSGVGQQLHSGPEFFWDKFFLLSEVSHPQRWVVAILFGAILLGGMWLLWQWRRQPEKQNLAGQIWLGWLANTAWFVALAKTGWPRHFWFGLVLAVLLLCVLVVYLLLAGIANVRPGRRLRSNQGPESRVQSPGSRVQRSKTQNPKLRTQNSELKTGKSSLIPSALLRTGTRHSLLITGLVLVTLIVWGFAVQPHVWGVFLPDEIVPYWQEKQINNKYGAQLPWIIIPRTAQSEIVAYLKTLPSKANVYYPAQHKAAEIPAQVGKVVYPLRRRSLMAPHRQDVVLVSPTLIAPWMEPVRRAALLDLVKEDCPEPILANDYYMLCPLPVVKES